MKLGKKILASLPELEFKVKVTEFKEFAVEGNEGYIDMNFTVVASMDELSKHAKILADLPKDTPKKDIPAFKSDYAGRLGTYRIWPGRQDWTFAQLVDKAELESIEDTDELNAKEIVMAYTHTYIDKNTGEIVRKKQWSLYPNS